MSSKKRFVHLIVLYLLLFMSLACGFIGASLPIGEEDRPTIPPFYQTLTALPTLTPNTCGGYYVPK